MSRENYFQVRKNKKAKKAKYSKLFTKVQIKKMEECFNLFETLTKKLKK